MSETKKTRVAVAVSELQHNDIIYLSDESDAVPYMVLDIGSPFILIENMQSHFANMFRVTQPLYKDL